MKKIILIFFILPFSTLLNAADKADWLVDGTQSSSGYFPGLSIATPGGYSGDWLEVSAGISTINRVRYDEFSDGSLFVGLGLGDHEDIVGLSITANFYDLFGKQFGKAIGLSAAISRHLGAGFSLGVGGQNLLVVDDGAKDFILPSYYVALSKGFTLSSSRWFNFLHLSVGGGNGSFNRERVANDILRGVEENFENVNIFGSMSLAVHSQLNLIGEYSGQNVNAGLSLLPFESINLNAGVFALDLLEMSGDGVRVGFQLTYSHDFAD